MSPLVGRVSMQRRVVPLKAARNRRPARRRPAEVSCQMCVSRASGQPIGHWSTTMPSL
ncbi:hypothetical protein BCO37747_00671 [Burkholderia contaminans]|nr:hypothetical protein SK875_B02256 [Burkholderia contaminans]VWC72766.1 hypothetical protein BCO37747_00671 [Burkholderia contaminans]